MKGYTLIELIVTIMILGIIGIVLYSAIKANYKIKDCPYCVEQIHK